MARYNLIVYLSKNIRKICKNSIINLIAKKNITNKILYYQKFTGNID